MKYLNTFFVLLALPGLIKAQNKVGEKFQVHTPNMYALGIYGDIPVDLSRGLPQINIPLLSITDKDIAVDVSLSYYPSGIKVDQEASCVGLGWALNAGGVITREMRGVPDEDVWLGASFNRTSIPDYNYQSSVETYGNSVESPLHSAAVNATDNEPDIFYYNFCGKAGKFYLDNNAKPCFAQYEDFIVEFVPNPYGKDSYFIITDDAGIKYEFKDAENTTTTPSPQKQYVTGWYLSKIESPSGGIINFTYKSGGTTAIYPLSRTYSTCYMAIDASVLSYTIPGKYQTPSFTSYSINGGLALDEISTSAGIYLSLEYDPNIRKDATLSNGNNQVNAIILKDANNTQKKKFKFNYSYFEANNSKKYTSAADFNYLNYRLRLDSLQEVDINDQLLSPYKFEYYGDNDPATDDPYTLPYRLSPCQDHWGFYNNSYNTSIFPNNTNDHPFYTDDWIRSFYPCPSCVGTSNNIVTGGGTREPDAEAIKAGMLKKITYPAKGYTEFEFEAQFTSLGTYYEYPAAMGFGGVRVKQIKTSDNNGRTMVKNYEYIPGYSSGITLDNKYYVFYQQGAPGGVPSVPDVMMALGIPAELANTSACFLRIDGSSKLTLGSGTGATYSHVAEISPGIGRIEYEYSYSDNNIGSSSDAIDNIPTPGLFLSAGIVTRTQSSQYQAQYIPKSINSLIFPYPEPLNNDWRSGHLIYKAVYSENNELVTVDSFEYEIRALNAAPGYKVICLRDPYEYLYAKSYRIGGLVKLKKEISRVYDASGNVVRKVKEHDYNSPYHKHVTETREYVSNGNVLTTRYYYPPDYGGYFSILKNKNIIALVDARTYKGGKLVSGKQLEYNDNGQPLIRYNAEPTTADIAFDVQNPFTFSPYLWNTYDPVSNNLQMQNARDGINNTYLWGYNQTYPVVKIENKAYADVFQTVKDAISGHTFSEKTDYASIKADRDYLVGQLSTLLSDQTCQVTFYTYAPLIGLTSSTDPNGQTTYYIYDSFGRLERVKDDKGNILNEYKYHYKE